jgi:type VI protein secretion system component VasK
MKWFLALHGLGVLAALVSVYGTIARLVDGGAFRTQDAQFLLIDAALIVFLATSAWSIRRK